MFLFAALLLGSASLHAREVYLLQTDLGNNIASVKAILSGKVLRFTTFISLVKLPSGDWQIVSDMPQIEKV